MSVEDSLLTASCVQGSHSIVSVRLGDEWHFSELGLPPAIFITNQIKEQISCHNTLSVSFKDLRQDK